MGPSSGSHCSGAAYGGVKDDVNWVRPGWLGIEPGLLDDFRDTEIEDLDDRFPCLKSDEQVGWLDVAVHDSFGVSACQAECGGVQQTEHLP